jgi:hypothetical protein
MSRVPGLYRPAQRQDHITSTRPLIRAVGHLDCEDADFLREAASFYRAIDHGQRVATGNAEGNLPVTQPQFDFLTNLVRRWTPPLTPDALLGHYRVCGQRDCALLAQPVYPESKG